jgi:two-component system, repressor protein LuxO
METDQQQPLDIFATVPALCGSSAIMQRLRNQIIAVAATRAPVLIVGENGTGKSLCAQLLHANSLFQNQNFISINCESLTRNQIDANLFGYGQNTLYNSAENRLGAIHTASQGTVFLDNIHELDKGIQTKLLHMMQNGFYYHLNDTHPQQTHARIICATNIKPDSLHHHSQLLHDLYDYLSVVTIHMPPLANRPDDIPELALHFLKIYTERAKKSFTSLAPETINVLVRYSWPGNIHQLENAIRYVTIFHDGPVVTPEMLPEALLSDQRASHKPSKSWTPAHGANDDGKGTQTHQQTSDQNLIVPLWITERDAICAAIDACHGNIPRAAAMLGVAPSTIYRKRIIWDTASAKSQQA